MIFGREIRAAYISIFVIPKRYKSSNREM